MNICKKYFSTCLLATAALLGGASPAWAQVSLGAALNFALLAGTAVTCTNSAVTGDVGVVLSTGFTNTSCTITGTVHAGDAAARAAYKDFLSAYAALQSKRPSCIQLTGNLAGVTLTTPGVYCVDAVAKTGTLTLIGNGPWIFLVNGALTGTNFSVVMAGGGQPCNVFWSPTAAATMTTSNFQGTILAGADITVTGGTFNGDALAGGTGSILTPTGAVTLTGAAIVAGCGKGALGAGASSCKGKDGDDKDKEHKKCNQGVGNGPEGCDPGNSNQGNPFRSNDEKGGIPGKPGRQGGNK